MKKAKTPVEESERLSSLKRLNILDTPLEERFDRITRLTRKSLGSPIALISLVDQNRQWFKSTQGLAASETPREISFCGHAIHSDEAFVVDDTSTDERFADNPLVTGDPRIRFYAGKPIKAPDGHRIGTLCVIDSIPRQFMPDDRSTLDDLAALVELELSANVLGETELELRSMLSEAERRAAIDPLTRLWNREITLQVLAKEIERSARQNLSMAVLMLDIDHFKTVNDRHGHLAGDRVLEQIAARMRAALRTPDTLGRYGGEEFLAVLPDCPEDQALTIAERVRSRVKDGPVKTDAGDIPVTLSIGVFAVRVEEILPSEEFIAVADRALYAAKESGRDRVVLGNSKPE